MFVGGGVVCPKCSSLFPMAAFLSMFMRAHGELLHLLTGVAPLDPGREGRVLSSEGGNR